MSVVWSDKISKLISWSFDQVFFYLGREVAIDLSRWLPVKFIQASPTKSFITLSLPIRISFLTFTFELLPFCPRRVVVVSVLLLLDCPSHQHLVASRRVFVFVVDSVYCSLLLSSRRCCCCCCQANKHSCTEKHSRLGQCPQFSLAFPSKTFRRHLHKFPVLVINRTGFMTHI